MGTWGASLYDDDEAGDLKNAIAVVCKVPGEGDRLVSLLKEMYGARDDRQRVCRGLGTPEATALELIGDDEPEHEAFVAGGICRR
jgi:hypothetical protein